MKLYERFGDGGFHTSIITSFGVDFDAYENIVLPRLRGGSCFNNVLLADSRMLTYALDGASLLPKYAGRHYTVSGVTAKATFHPKIAVQFGRRAARLIVSSANITASGLAGNIELAGLIDCTQDPNGEQQLIAAAWNYLKGLIAADQQAISHQIDWMRARAPWLFDVEPAKGPVSLGDGSVGALLTSSAESGIGRRFQTLIEARPAQRLIVISPYWDEDLAALRYLADTLNAKEIVILVDCDKQLFPKEGLHDLPPTKIFDLKEFAQKRFVHAKAIIVETKDADHVLYGSANCTLAALGNRDFVGLNEEACLYRRLQPNTVLDFLGLTNVLASATAIAPTDLPKLDLGESIPLEEAAARSPGRFESMFDTLVWWPPISVSLEATRIELLDAKGQLLSGTLSPLDGSTKNARRFQTLGFVERPSFAQLRFEDGIASGRAVITLVDILREAIREARGKHAASAAAQLSEETEESLWLMEVLNDLEAAEAALQNEENPGVRRTREKASDTVSDGQYRTLSYDQFIAGRRLRSEERNIARNSLSGSELSLVRNFLNRILAIGDANIEQDALLDEKAIQESLDLGDETADAERSLESGEEFPTRPTSTQDRSDEDEAKSRRAQAMATRDQIISAVERFNEKIRAKADAAHVTSFDVLRLRAILMIVARAAQPIKSVEGRTSGQTLLQVLPLDDSSEAWPKLMGRILFAFFGGNRPAIRSVQIEAIHDQLPDDILECWATCLWVAQVCVLAAGSHRGLKQNFLSMLTALMHRVYALTGLRRSELQSDRVASVLTALNARFSNRLGLDAKQIERGHQVTCAEQPALAT